MTLRTRWKVLGICGAVAAIGVASMRYLAPCKYECRATEFDDGGLWIDIDIRGDYFGLTNCYYDFCPGGGEGTIDSGGRLHQIPDEMTQYVGSLDPMRLDRAPDGRPLAISFEDGSGLHSALECSANPWWFIDTPTLEFERSLGRWPWYVLIGLVLGVPLSLLEARRASRSSRGRRLALKALILRLLLPLGLLGVSSAWIALHIPRLAQQVSLLWPQGGIRVGVCALALGQILAAGIVAYRREDDPAGALRSAPSIGTLLVIIAAYGSALAFIPSPREVYWVEPASVMLILWGLLYLSAPRLLWLALPGPVRRRVQQAGLALLLFAFGQTLVASDSARYLLNVFWGADAYGFSPEQLRMLRVEGAVLSVIAIGGSIAVVTLEIAALLRRRAVTG